MLVVGDYEISEVQEDAEPTDGDVVVSPANSEDEIVLNGVTYVKKQA